LSTVPSGGPGSAHWLVIAEEQFVPTDSGGRVESLNILRAVAASGVGLHVIVPGLRSAAAEDAHRAALPTAVLDVIPRRTGWLSHLSPSPYLFVSRPLPPDLIVRLRALHRDSPYTAVVAISFRVVHLAHAIAAALDLPVLVRPHNVESEYFRELSRSAPLLRKLPYLLEAWKLRRAEASVHASPLTTLFADISDDDARLRRLRTSVPVVHVPPFLAPRPAQPVVRGLGRESTVLFVGSLDNDNNAAGVRWFVQRCWPVLRSRIPTADLHVVGRRAPADLVDEIERAGARVTVDAPDVAQHLAHAAVFVNPVQRGAGVNIKMVEAMAAGLPVVTTSIGARGLHWRDGEHLVVADDPAEFGRAVASLLDDAALRARLAEAGRRFVELELDGVRQVNRLQQLLRSATARG
jgi:glycosyltransferase involved in cell wall biosynthesis